MASNVTLEVEAPDPNKLRNDSAHVSSGEATDDRISPSARERPLPQPLPYEICKPLLYGLHNQGWTILDLRRKDTSASRIDDDFHHSKGSTLGQRESIESEPEPRVWQAISDLFSDAKTFFDATEDYKSTYGKDDSEEGWTKINGEKEFVTIRGMTSRYTPNEVRRSAEEVWKHVFVILNKSLGHLATSMKLHQDALQRFCESSRELGQKNGSSMIRIFRYENDAEYKTLAEAHRDLGILSLVVGDKPGLEVWNKRAGFESYMPIERSYSKGMCTLMGGRQLEHFSNGTYEAAAHRVVSYGPDQSMLEEPVDDLPISYRKEIKSMTKDLVKKFKRKPRADTIPGRRKELNAYRYSMVFVLRADRDVQLNYASLSSPVCGDVTYKAEKKGAPTTAGELFDNIRKAHFNVNTQVDEREKQKQELTVQKNHAGVEEQAERARAHGVGQPFIANGIARVVSPITTPCEDDDAEFEPPPHPPPSHVAK